MAAILDWVGDDEEPVPASFSSSQHRTRGRRTLAPPGELPPDIQAAIWLGDQLGSPVSTAISSGFAALDAELPGAGWPCHSLTEILQPQPTVTEWRLLAPAMRQVVASGGNIVVVGPPKSPHLPGLRYAGLDERHLVWIQAEAPAERLWVTEQLIKTNAAGLLVAWLPQTRQEQIRRLQVCAQACEGPAFLCRPAAAEHESSAAPLRVQLTFGQVPDRAVLTDAGGYPLRCASRRWAPNVNTWTARPWVSKQAMYRPNGCGVAPGKPSRRSRQSRHLVTTWPRSLRLPS